MKLNVFAVLILIFALSACSLIDQDEGVVLSVSSENLIIENNFDVKIYYNVMDNNCAPYTDWAPHQNDNYAINSNNSTIILFKNIYTDKNRILKKGDKVELVWWTDEFVDENHSFGYDEVGKSNGVERIKL